MIIGSAPTKVVVASMIVEAMKFQMISPEAKNGRNSYIGDLKSPPKITPIQPIMTPVEIVIQNGPRVERLYLCRMSDLAR